MKKLLPFGLAAALLTGCENPVVADIVIKNGDVFVGDQSPAQPLTIAIRGEKIVYIGDSDARFEATETIDATGKFVLPGFIDPHTHSWSELSSLNPKLRSNKNYQFQGVTTVINGNDGFGSSDIAQQMALVEDLGVGTNTALFIGHGALRTSVMGGAKRPPTDEELTEMKEIVDQGMQDGALGLSTGLFYAPGSFSETEEIIALAKIVAEHDGLYDSHIRDEATYTIGLVGAVEEAVEVGRKANVAVNIAHIKALGVDVWGKSEALIDLIEAAQNEGLEITADQYPWRASGTRISNAIIPRWVKAGTEEDYFSRLNDPNLQTRIVEEATENLRRRGGADAVLITQDNPDWQGQTLGELAKKYRLSPVETALKLAREGDARIASFNMSLDDIEAFMVQDWVMTSSDGSTGHPRKYASYPEKYQTFILGRDIMSVETFFYRSSGMVADNFGLCDRGYLKAGYKADIAIIDPEDYRPVADFQNPAELSEGVEYLFVNGESVIHQRESVSALPGQVLKRCKVRGE